MKTMKISELLTTICVSYTVISLVATVVNQCAGCETNNLNVFSMFLFTAIAVFVLSIHRLFDGWSPLLMIIVQYVIAIGLVMLVVFIIGRFNPVAEGGYRDIFRSFTIPYVIGAGIYYISVFHTAKQQNELIQEIKQLQKEKAVREK